MSIIASDFIDLESFDQPLAAILKSDCHGHQGANLQWPNIHFCSQDINQHICQIWCLYHKMNNWFGMLSYAAPLYIMPLTYMCGQLSLVLVNLSALIHVCNKYENICCCVWQYLYLAALLACGYYTDTCNCITREWVDIRNLST